MHTPSIVTTTAQKAPWIRWVCLLLLCAAYLQGGINKLTDFNSAIGEMRHFGLSPAAPWAALVIALELGASVAILTGYYRWLGAGFLGVFTLMATFLANRFWEMGGQERFMAANSFFEHLGLTGAFLLVAWLDLQKGSNGTR
ncbi:DoxX family membrane protein [Duganella sp. FT50W]|uniref:DoxX family membrane protein n=1 Tax=Duganella lactea TaxID=2692173 RepID=A0A6L8MHV5_9BURK|nr:DoxX family protein [Duganella lactea]MYM82660.1 DoxX family membrane protein [Duganella lactea]